MNNLTLDAAQSLLMAKVAARLDDDVRCVFWETLPHSIPDWKAHLPALTAAVRKETNPVVLGRLSAYPLPTTLSPETADWRQELVNAWEDQLKTARKTLDRDNRNAEWGQKYRYIFSLRGLTQIDRCSVPPGLTCPSVLPTLLSEARCQRFQGVERLECLSVLSGWRPAGHVITDPATLKAWATFWLELYQQGDLNAEAEEEPDYQVIKKGIAAKALLNLIEIGDKEETGIPGRLEPLLLEDLTTAAVVAGENPCLLNPLSWQPKDVTRFSIDRLAKVPETLLEKVRLLCREPDRWEIETQQAALYDALEELFRWNESGLLAACRIDLFSCIVPDVSDYLNDYLGTNVDEAGETFPNHKLYSQLNQFVRDEVASVTGGRKLLQKLESHWQNQPEPADSLESDCLESDRYDTWNERIQLYRHAAWHGRIQLQRTGLATETPSAFCESLLEALKKERSPIVLLALSLWRVEKNAPGNAQRKWERRWEKRLKSDDEAVSLTAALALLRPAPDDDLVAPMTRWQRLRDILCALPGEIHPQLSIAELTYLMKMAGELPSDSGAVKAGQSWQFSADGMVFRIPTKSTAPVIHVDHRPDGRPGQFPDSFRHSLPSRPETGPSV